MHEKLSVDLPNILVAEKFLLEKFKKYEKAVGENNVTSRRTGMEEKQNGMSIGIYKRPFGSDLDSKTNDESQPNTSSYFHITLFPYTF